MAFTVAAPHPSWLNGTAYLNVNKTVFSTEYTIEPDFET